MGSDELGNSSSFTSLAKLRQMVFASMLNVESYLSISYLSISFIITLVVPVGFHLTYSFYFKQLMSSL